MFLGNISVSIKTQLGTFKAGATRAYCVRCNSWILWFMTFAVALLDVFHDNGHKSDVHQTTRTYPGHGTLYSIQYGMDGRYGVRLTAFDNRCDKRFIINRVWRKRTEEDLTRYARRSFASFVSSFRNFN